MRFLAFTLKSSSKEHMHLNLNEWSLGKDAFLVSISIMKIKMSICLFIVYGSN